MVNVDEMILSLIHKWNGWGSILFTFIAIVLTGILSSLIGIEREMKGQPAGLRTHVLLSIGSAFLMIISIFAVQFSLDYSGTGKQEVWNLNLDVTRIGAGILSGIGFMGAGAIVKNGLNIRGLTTAATLWLASAIGMACGCGFIMEAIVVTLIAMTFLIGLTYIEKLMDKRAPQIHLVVAPNIPVLHEIRSQADKYRLVIKNIETNDIVDPKGNEQVEVHVFFAYHSDIASLNDFIDSFQSYPYIYKVSKTKEHKRKNIDRE